jgi:hypothetical protein
MREEWIPMLENRTAHNVGRCWQRRFYYDSLLTSFGRNGEIISRTITL